MYKELISFIKDTYSGQTFIPLHAPKFKGRELDYLKKCIETTMVSSVGEFVDNFEKLLSQFTGAPGAVAVVNGTSALHAALVLSDVKHGDEVLTQSLTFIATANAISYTGASPVFIDCSMKTMGMCADKLEEFLSQNTKVDDSGNCINLNTKAKIKACVPMHTFGHPCEIDRITEICHKYKITVIEDAAESLGSYYKGKHTGLWGDIGIFSFNGNKIVTSGGGGAIISNRLDLCKTAKHLTTTAKKTHAWEYEHDLIGFNYRMPNINAALACAQMETLNDFLIEKRTIALSYKKFFETNKFATFVDEPVNSKSNFWLNAILFKNRSEQQSFLEESNPQGVMTRPIWVPMHKLPMYSRFETTDMSVTEHLSQVLVNLPSGVRP